MGFFSNLREENIYLRKQITILQRELERHHLTSQQRYELETLGFSWDIMRPKAYSKIERLIFDGVEYGILFSFPEIQLAQLENITEYITTTVNEKVRQETQLLIDKKKLRYEFHWSGEKIKNCISCPLVRTIGDFKPFVYICNLRGRVDDPCIKPSNCPLKEI